MCLALPGLVEEQDGFFAMVRIGKIRRKVLNAMDAKTGEWVLVENGLISEKLDAGESQLMAHAWAVALKRKKKKTISRNSLLPG